MTYFKNLLLTSLVYLLPLGAAPTNEKLTALYESLNPSSIREHLAFYELYKETDLGKVALTHAWKLISGNDDTPSDIPALFPKNVDAFISLIHPIKEQEITQDTLKIEAIAQIDSLATNFSNRKLKGHKATTLQEIFALDDFEIDLSRALLLSQFPNDLKKVELFEASLDLMALQVQAMLPKQATPYEKIEALNEFIFFEMGFRFPPHSAYSGKIDHFTFLPHILESRRGVCLGVSTLYLCLAERIDLSLEIITPPGHIYIRHQEKNIETTCRGVHIPTSEYLSINTKTLTCRKRKEVIGMAHFNHASTYLAQGDFPKALECYEKASLFITNDTTLSLLHGATLFLCDRQKEAYSVLNKAKLNGDPTVVSQNSLLDDLLNKKVDKEALAPYFLFVDETRESILRKKEGLEESCRRCPEFRMGLFQLAMCWLQLQQAEEAIKVLERYHALDPTDITVEFYLAELYASRYDAPSAWKHCLIAQKLATQASYMPSLLKRFAVSLSNISFNRLLSEFALP